VRGEEEDCGEGGECGRYIDGTGSGSAHGDIKKRRGLRGRWWRRIAAFSLLLLTLLAVIAVMCVPGGGERERQSGGGD
jgi:hypothetical protein